MISDVLSDAVNEIDRYLTDLVFKDMYSDPPLNARIVKLRTDMVAMVVELDTPPGLIVLQPPYAAHYTYGFLQDDDQTVMKLFKDGKLMQSIAFAQYQRGVELGRMLTLDEYQEDLKANS